MLIHPAMHRNSRAIEAFLEFEIEVRNHRDIVAACGPEGEREALAALLARVQRALAAGGVASPEAGGRFAVVVWDGSVLGPDRIDDWLDALAADLVLEPVATWCGPVHLDVALTKKGKAAPHPGALPGGRRAPEVVGEEARRTYLADMALVSPVLAALGGFRRAGREQIDVDVCWRPVSDSQSSGSAAYFEATLGLISAAGQFTPSDRVLEAAGRLGLVHLLDHYLVSRVIDELIAAPGAVSLAVSVSDRSLGDVRFWRAALDRLEFAGATARDLIVEVRGNATCGGAQGSGETLARLKRLGCRTSLGNFGLGATSLRDAVAFAPDLVTVDRHFLSSAAGAAAGHAALFHLVALARAVGAEVVIDGVDSAELASVSRELGASLFKGDWCGRPRVYRSWAHRPRPQACPRASADAS